MEKLGLIGKRAWLTLVDYFRMHGNVWAAAFPLYTSLLVQSQVLNKFFYRDDFLHFFQIGNWPPLEFIFSTNGGHLYIVRNLVFYLSYKIFGVSPLPFFAIV